MASNYLDKWIDLLSGVNFFLSTVALTQAIYVLCRYLKPELIKKFQNVMFYIAVICDSLITLTCIVVMLALPGRLETFNCMFAETCIFLFITYINILIMLELTVAIKLATHSIEGLETAR